MMTTTPTLTPVVYLRGARMPDTTWDRIRRVMAVRGWVTVTDRTQAWHLARGGTPVVLCDFSADQDATTGPWVGYDMRVTVGRVRARYGTTPTVATVGSLLPTAEYARLSREANTDWLDLTVETTQTEYELIVAKGSLWVDRPFRDLPDGGRGVDENALADWVATALWIRPPAEGKTP